MPTHERWKPYGLIINGVRCKNVADSECIGRACQHEEHPRFVCDDCEEVIRVESEQASQKPYTCDVCGHRVYPESRPHEHGIPILWKVNIEC